MKYHYLNNLLKCKTTAAVVKAGDPDAPNKSLRGFKRISLKAGQKQQVDFELDAAAFSFYDNDKAEVVLKPGNYQILYGASSLEKDLQVLSLKIVK